MVKGILKTTATLCLTLILGVVCFRTEEVWNVLVHFYTNWSPELVGTLLVAGALTAIRASKELGAWIKGGRERRMARSIRRKLKEKKDSES